jgi:hypothetical protein
VWSGVSSAVLDWLTGGSALAALGKVSLAVCALVFGLIYRRYLGILGADRRKPAERQAYDALRDSLAEATLRHGSTPNGSPGSSIELIVSSVTRECLTGRSSRTRSD